MGGISNTLALVHLVLPLLELVPTLGQTPTRIPLGVLVPDSSSPLKQIIESEFEKFNGTSTSLFKFDIQRLGSGYSVDVANATRSMCSMVSTGILAMIGMTDGDVDHMVNDVADTYNIPYVNLNGPHSPPPSGESDGVSHPYTVYIRPPFEKAISEFILFNQSKWTKIFYIFDNSAGFSRMERLTNRIRNEYRTLQVKPVLFKDVNQSQKKFRDFDVDESDRASRFVLLDLSSTATLKTLLSQLSAVGKDGSNYHYLIGGSFLAELELDDFKRNGAKLTGFNLIKHKTYGERLYLQNKSQVDLALATDAVAVVTHGLLTWHDSDPGALQGVPRHLENRKQGGSQCDQISTTSWKSGMAILDAFKMVDFQGETGRVSFDGLGHRKDYEFGIYELNNSRNRPEEIATWEPRQGLKLKSAYDAEQIPAVVKSNSSETIIVTTILAAPYMMYKQSEPGRRLTGNDRYEGYLADLTRLLQRIVGFEYEFREVKDGRYGMKNPDGTWNGMIGELTRREADVAIAPLTISSMRERVVDFSRPYMALGISIMIKKPEKQQRSFFDVFSLGAWAAILLTYLVVCLFYCFVDRFTRGICKQTNSNMAGSSNNSTSWSRWLLGLVCWLFTLSLFAVLTAQISQFSNSRSIQLTPIESADDLSKQEEIKYGTLDAGSTKDFFKTSGISTYEKMWKSMSDNPDVFVKSTEEGVQRVRNSKGRYAFLLESPMNDYYNQRKPCDTMKVGKNLDAKGYGLAFPINSDFGARMNLALLELAETGELAKLEKKWWYDKGECLVDGANPSEDAPITLMRKANDLAGLFYILIGGLVLSIVVLSIECLFESRKNKSFQLKPKE